MERKVFSGHQPNFLPYLGVFYKIAKSDVFVFDDDVQYSSTGLHNANYMKISGNRSKITVPVNVKFGEPINKAKICYERNWIEKLLRSLKMNYRHAKHFEEGYSFIERYLNAKYVYLSDMNIAMIREMSCHFGIDTKFIVASKDVPTDLKNNERNVFQCLQSGCNVYYSGIGGKEYNDEAMYQKNGIEIVYSDFDAKPYPQLGKEFVPNLSVLDYVMNNGFVLPEGWCK